MAPLGRIEPHLVSEFTGVRGWTDRLPGKASKLVECLHKSDMAEVLGVFCF